VKRQMTMSGCHQLSVADINNIRLPTKFIYLEEDPIDYDLKEFEQVAAGGQNC